MQEVKIISLWNPWATMIVTPHPDPKIRTLIGGSIRGIKQFETRSWIIKPGDYLIHAAKKWGDEQIYKTTNNPHFIKYMKDLTPMAFGAIIGKVTFGEHISSAVFQANGPAYSTTPEEEYYFGDWSPNRFGIIIKNPVKFKDPIPWRGQQGVWKIPLRDLPLEIQAPFL
jgi:hypothetical protein